MGQTYSSTGPHALDPCGQLSRFESGEFVVALAGNPNVGKSTIFNALTGMNQHTGNWPGKTVSGAKGCFSTEKGSYIMVDLPGTYSLYAHSPEEEITRDFICYGNADAVMIVCDATCLERNMNLVLQTLEITSNVIVCVNLLDEAGRKKIKVDLKALEKCLGVPVIGTVGHNKKSVRRIREVLDRLVEPAHENTGDVFSVKYPEPIEMALDLLEKAAETHSDRGIPRRFLMRLLEDNVDVQLAEALGKGFFENEEMIQALEEARASLSDNGIDREKLSDMSISATVAASEQICSECVIADTQQYNTLDRKLDRILTGRLCAYPLMILFFAFIFWLTITGANYPSEALSRMFVSLEAPISGFLVLIHTPVWLHDMLVLGVYRVLTWVVSVMLPPMAIFFPLFTLLEDAGYLPRIAYNLDKAFCKCNACGKQALTM